MTRPILQLMMITSLLFLLAGCIEVRMETDLNGDGSGHGEIEIAICPAVTAKLAETAHLTDMPRTEVGDIAELDDARLQVLAAPAGVTVSGFESRVIEGRRTVSFAMEFGSLEGYSWVLGNVFDEVGDGLGVFAGQDGNLVFKEAQYDMSDLVGKVPALPERTDPGDEAMDMFMELRGVINAHVADARVVNVITVPGDVIDTDATAMEERTCTWELDFAAIRADKDALKPMIEFDGAGLSMKPMGDGE